MLRNKILLVISCLSMAAAAFSAGALSGNSGQASDDSEFQRGVEHQKQFTLERCLTYAKAYPYLEFSLGPSTVWCKFFTGELKSREELGL